jgi:hypothetical protein
MGQQAELMANFWQVVESAHGHLHLVAHAMTVQHNLGRVFVIQPTGEFAYHLLPIIGAL